MGSALLSIGDARAAYDHFCVARTALASLGRLPDLAMCNGHIGLALLGLRRYAKAAEYLLEAMAGFQRLSLTKEAAQCELNVGLCLYGEDKFYEALSHFNAGLKTFQSLHLDRETADCLVNIGITHRDLKEPLAAIDCHRHALEIYAALGLQREASACDNNMAVALYDLGRLEEALDRSTRAIDAVEGFRSEFAAMQYRARFTEEHRGGYMIATLSALALRRFTESLVYLERSRAKTLADSMGTLLECEPGELDTGLYQQFCAARRALMEAGLTLSHNPAPSTYQRTADSRQKTFRTVLDEILSRYPETSFSRRLRAATITYLKDKDEYIGLLPDSHSCLVDFLTWSEGNDALRAFVVSAANGLELVEFPDNTLTALMALTTEWQAIYSGQMSLVALAQMIPKVCFQLHELIMGAQVKVMSDTTAGVRRCRFLDYLDETIPKRTQGLRSLCIIPHRLLFHFPLHAAARRDGDRLKYLLEDYVISYAPSAYLLQHATRRRTGLNVQKRAMVVGNPMPSHMPLPGAADEARWVATHLRKSGWQVDELLETHATKRAFLARINRKTKVQGESYSHLHLAQHATIRRDGRAALVFSQASANPAHADSLCMDSDIVGAPLAQVESIVAAACLSVLTDPGLDDYVGLGAAFLQAGVPTYVGTLYPLSDEGSRRLVPELYRARLDQHLSWAEALRDAQMKMIRSRDKNVKDMQTAKTESPQQYLGSAESTGAPGFDILPSDHPYHWAAFTVTGAP